MVSYLGVNIKKIDEDCFFEHPVTEEPVYVVPDACLKLVRNTFAGSTIYDRENNVISWSHLVNLVEIQEREELYPATKLRRRHIYFQNEKMKVKLAAQVLSESVAKALLYMQKRFPSKFIGASSTSIFCQIFNDCFDILNSRRQCGKNVYQKAITRTNIIELKEKIFDFIEYIKSLRILEGKTIKPILESSRKIGFLGIIVGLKSVLNVSNYLFTNDLMSYVLTYKFSQDHLETFFSSIRKMGGFCNNPTCYQFRSSYKKLVSHVNDINVSSGNCISQDETSILQIKKETDELNLQNLLNMACDHDYDGLKGWSWDEYRLDIVTYIAGFIVKSIKKTSHCEMCIESLESKETKCELINLKNRKKSTDVTSVSGLVFPSKDVITVCKIAEQVLRNTKKVFAIKKILDFLMISARKQILPLHLFEELDLCPNKHVLSDHKFELTNKILKKYFTIRLQHKSKSLQDAIPRIRTHFNRLVFKNQ